MDVVSVGHASIDRVEINGMRKKQPGGAGIYSAMAANIFVDSAVVSRVGTDFPGGFFTNLHGIGIDIAGIKQVSGKSTFFDISYNENNQAVYNTYSLGVGVHIRPEDIPKKHLTAGAFHIAPMAASKQRAFVEFLRENTYGLISLNTHAAYFARYRKELLGLIPDVDIFTINDEEAMLLTKTKSIEQAINAFKKLEANIAVITMGVYGSVVIEKGEINFSPSVIQHHVVDLTGCGDVYGGSFIACYMLTENALKSANIANSVASISASDWSFSAIKNLKFGTLEAFQKFVVLRQSRLSKTQRNLENYI
ncbi:MAG TPA: carbohydrate kinase family protein [Euryarchaeota archaeon]|nr:aminoimidazole riboside kinase [archaeon BMS3Bbin15]HDL16176.1 carbohydrate kinase family protein [Euryarchaeota archaeon]